MVRPNYSAQAPASSSPGQPRRRDIFISYSHLDATALAAADLPKRFHAELLQLARNWPEFGITGESIFFDRHGLLAGDEWQAKIVAALERCEIFILLASPNALASDYCMRQELALAVAMGKRIIPVVLAECQWRDHLIEGDAAGRRLGAFDAVPKDEHQRPRAIELWANQAQALNVTMAQLKALMQHLVDTPQPLGLTRSMRPTGLSPLLPFSCNQVEPETDFDGGLSLWRSRALLVLVRGEYVDHVPGFWSRLLAKNLVDGCARLGEPLLQDRPVKSWPVKAAGSTQALADAVRFSLADAITLDRGGLPNPEALGQALKGLPGVLPLNLSAPGGAAVLKESLRVALAIIDAAPDDAPLHRLVIAVLVDDKTLVAEDSLVSALEIGAPARTHVIAPTRLQPLTPDDVRQWYDDSALESHCAIDREALVEQVFGGAETLRMRSFNQQVRSLVGLPSR